MNSIENLEQRCRKLVDKLGREENGIDSGEPLHVIESEIALILDQIDEVRFQQDKLVERMTVQEMDLKTRIANLKTPPFEYRWDRWAERTRMKNQLQQTMVRLEQQRQRLLLDRERAMQRMQDRLLALWNKRELLSPSES